MQGRCGTLVLFHPRQYLPSPSLDPQLDLRTAVLFFRLKRCDLSVVGPGKSVAPARHFNEAVAIAKGGRPRKTNSAGELVFELVTLKEIGITAKESSPKLQRPNPATR